MSEWVSEIPAALQFVAPLAVFLVGAVCLVAAVEFFVRIAR